MFGVNEAFVDFSRNDCLLNKSSLCRIVLTNKPIACLQTSLQSNRLEKQINSNTSV